MIDALAGILEIIVTFARSWWTLAGFVIAFATAYVIWLVFPALPYREGAAILCFIFIFGGTLLCLWAKGDKI